MASFGASFEWMRGFRSLGVGGSVFERFVGVEGFVQRCEGFLQGGGDGEGFGLLGNVRGERRKLLRRGEFLARSVSEWFHGFAERGEDVGELAGVLEGEVAAGKRSVCAPLSRTMSRRTHSSTKYFSSFHN
jgi:hypothetical protein